MNPKQTFIVINQHILDNVLEYARGLPVDGTMEVEFRPRKKSRSQQQNAALWAIPYPALMEFMGLRGEKEREELHEYFCGEFFGWKEYMIMDKKKVRPKRTTTTNEEGKRDLIDKAEMVDFYSFVQQKAAESGVYVADPDPLYFMEK